MHRFAKVGMRGCNVSTVTKKCNSLNGSNKNEDFAQHYDCCS